jgi:hypothetical protein
MSAVQSLYEENIMLNHLSNTISRIRRNHALEHATLSVLNKRHPRKGLVGNSDVRGFWVFGDVPTELLQESVDEALARLKNGEHQLAIHPNCGTNFVTSGVLAGSFAWLGMLGTRSKRDSIDRLPLVMSLVTIALIISQPLGPLFQARFTIDPKVGQMQVVEITKFKRRDIPVHRVKTRN